MNQNRKTIAPQDVFKALEDLEFPEFKPRLEMELARSWPVFPGVR
jgi:DNA polymerase epsilon subunit 3